MPDDRKLSCGCVRGVRVVTVVHCGGHAIPPDRTEIEEENVLLKEELELLKKEALKIE